MQRVPRGYEWSSAEVSLMCCSLNISLERLCFWCTHMWFDWHTLYVMYFHKFLSQGLRQRSKECKFSSQEGNMRLISCVASENISNSYFYYYYIFFFGNALLEMIQPFIGTVCVPWFYKYIIPAPLESISHFVSAAPFLHSMYTLLFEYPIYHKVGCVEGEGVEYFLLWPELYARTILSGMWMYLSSRRSEPSYCCLCMGIFTERVPAIFGRHGHSIFYGSLWRQSFG